MIIEYIHNEFIFFISFNCLQTVKRTIRVKTSQHILPDLPPVEGFPMRQWAIEIVLLDQDNKEIPLNIVDKVVYHLHPTFANPNRTYTEAPYRIEEQGWGGFALNISLFLLDKGGERKVTHDLNFVKDEYQVDHVISAPININKPNLIKELAKSGLVPSEESITPNKRKITVTSSASSSTTNLAATTNKAVTSEPKPKKQKLGSQPMIKGSVDIERLAFGLTKLKDDDLVEIVHIITNNITPDMNFTNNVEEGAFTMDLFSLPETLLQTLWEFVKTHADKKEKEKEKDKETENDKEKEPAQEKKA